eukprot:CAMPEP_0177450124 /NCGR_PEP_ID=MMETSP0369-20130122/9082_1 /TAXON_ID=447022 ORGANISM="Scrippsiella hangoei-like, Strain SHHI-4" /NCGR_SAMPLE_ID=MMETSP0369 /ASSEMBLY_ACC=CAM_ASM_000364 /LENGTH=55 /DNA_ID=CAMNT_0018922659 /DNA_START=155 /DNA_END=322 /DNA_ORIENTATION=+
MKICAPGPNDRGASWQSLVCNLRVEDLLRGPQLRHENIYKTSTHPGKDDCLSSSV